MALSDYAVCFTDKRHWLDSELFTDQKKRTMAMQVLAVAGDTGHKASHATVQRWCLT